MINHDPRRVHPPAEAERKPRRQALPVLAVAEAPRVLQTYRDPDVPSMVSIALGGTGEPHRVVYVFTLAPHRNQGRIRALMTQLLADLDAEAAECIIIIRNVEPGCDIPRLTTFFESLGYVQETPDPPTLRRLPQPAS